MNKKKSHSTPAVANGGPPPNNNPPPPINPIIHSVARQAPIPFPIPILVNDPIQNQIQPNAAVVAWPPIPKEIRLVGGKSCKVTRFKRGGKNTIQNWFYQMEFHFEANSIPEEQWVKACIVNFHYEHFTEVKEQKLLPFRDFKAVMIELFKEPERTHSKIQELLSMQQDVDEKPEEFMT